MLLKFFFFFFFAYGKFGSHGLFAIYWISRNNGPRCIGATLYKYSNDLLNGKLFKKDKNNILNFNFVYKIF